MKKIIAAIFVIAFLFANIGIQGAFYTSPTGNWYGPGGNTVGKGQHGGHSVSYGPGGIESVTVYCDDQIQWKCWEIDGAILYIDPIQTGPGDRMDQIFVN